MNAITEGVEISLKKGGFEPLNIEGTKGSHWILLDYDDVIVHLFRKEERAFYNLDGLWGDAPKVDMEEIEEPVGKLRRIV